MIVNGFDHQGQQIKDLIDALNIVNEESLRTIATAERVIAERDRLRAELYNSDELNRSLMQQLQVIRDHNAELDRQKPQPRGFCGWINLWHRKAEKLVFQVSIQWVRKTSP